MVLNSVPTLVFNEENNVLLFKIISLLKVVKPETFNVEFNWTVPETVNELFKDVKPETANDDNNVVLSFTDKVLLNEVAPETVNALCNDVEPDTANVDDIDETLIVLKPVYK